ncbi:MAG: Maf family nucleotide pyrophosphatase [Bacteroidales bacterium]
MEQLDCLKKYDIILGSQSPRRKALMEGAGIPFRVEARPTKEVFPEGLSPVEVVKLLCRQKALEFSEELKNPLAVVITADTIVVHRGRIINKPVDEADAIAMLKGLSGSMHEVYTGVCICRGTEVHYIYDRSAVHFRHLTEQEICHYVEHYAPYDKAGAYGIQEWIGYVGINGIEGSYHNVMGLPVHKVYEALLGMLCP